MDNNVLPCIDRDALPCTLVPMDDYNKLVEARAKLNLITRFIENAAKTSKYDSDFRLIVCGLLDISKEAGDA